MALVVAGPAGLVMSNIQFGALLDATVTSHSATQIVYDLHDGQIVTLSGSGLSIGADDILTGGMVTGASATMLGQSIYQASAFSVQATTVQTWIAQDAYDAALGTVLGGADTIIGSDTGNVLVGFGGNDSVVGGAGRDSIMVGGIVSTVFGGAGADFISGPGYLRGGDGDDTIAGTSVNPGTFDNINGNQGNDSISGQGGNDWLLGGQGDDTIVGGQSPGDQIINGNMGNDVIIGNDGDDTLRGGQGNDLIDDGIAANWSGNDHLFGDRGDDTLTGGGEEDTFHFSPGGGHDLITHFETDILLTLNGKVQHRHDWIELDGVTNYTVTQVGADIVIDIGGGDQLRIANLNGFSADWIVKS